MIERGDIYQNVQNQKTKKMLVLLALSSAENLQNTSIRKAEGWNNCFVARRKKNFSSFLFLAAILKPTIMIYYFTAN